MTRKTYHSLFRRFRGRFGPGRCGLCGNVLPSRKKRWCSERCVTFLELISGANFIWRNLTFKKDNYTCQHCGRKMRRGWYYRTPPQDGRRGVRKYYHISSGWIMDHTIPIALGGNQYDFGNLQTLCPGCDKQKTSHDISFINSRKLHSDKSRMIPLEDY